MSTTGEPFRRAVVLVSGGLDSAVALAVARSEGYVCTAVSVDYGQRHRVELEAAGRVVRQVGGLGGVAGGGAAGAIEHRVVAVDLRAIGGSALTDTGIEVPKGRSDVERGAGVPITYVPARNLIFLSIAAGLAESIGAADLFIGANAIDYSGYPDCREPFLRAFEKAATLGTRSGTELGRGFKVHAPLVALTKAQIIRVGASLGVDFSLTSSCYDPEERTGRACGRCDSCLIRAKGFAEAGVGDPTRYVEVPRGAGAAAGAGS